MHSIAETHAKPWALLRTESIGWRERKDLESQGVCIGQVESISVQLRIEVYSMAKECG